jgi:endonuclease/exonuclease/phosphatase family metal-dependent hydrolase
MKSIGLKKIYMYFLYFFMAGIGIFAAAGGLFVMNGLLLAEGENPVSGTTSYPSESENRNPDEIKIISYNIAKGFIIKEGLNFSDKKTIKKRMTQIAELIVREKADIVFLSEAIFECTPCPVNQIVFLAEASGMHSWAFGENYNFGLPFYRIVGGNAILSRFPLETIANPSLAGRKPFYVTTNNRRVLWCALHIGEKSILAASVHNDSHSRENNLIQVRQLLAYKGDRPALMAGDFNSNPGELPIELIRNTGQFTASFEGPPTFPSGRANQKIDFIFAPRKWKLLKHRVIQTNLSDHYPVVSVFRIDS